ncbi:Globin [Sulfidibacter corallicola]|uniref:Globin n=1 Tax=Sulfidibacter corallicola TaxID=2818388 RepID=A0A8A4TTS0_SULCO|nr:globin [Sulfidibacter corallicola]QTD49935.1 globin [Sulfidibacter corallicola]
MTIPIPLKESLFRITGDTVEGWDSFLETFYNTFFASSPEVAAKFKRTKLKHQRLLLRRSLESILKMAWSTEIPIGLDEIAERHDRNNLDIRPYLYELWEESLIQTVSRVDPYFDEEVELSWRIALEPGIKFMIDHYRAS